MIEITTDSCEDLTKTLFDRYHLRFISLPVLVNGKNYKDGVDITPPDLYKAVEESGVLPKTSAPSVADFIQFFEASPADEIIFCSISSKLSATFQAATLASQSVKKKIHIIDSLNLSTGIAHVAMLGAELRDQGLPAEKIIAEMNALIPKVHTSFVIDTMEYLFKGGRCSAMQYLMGSLIRIRPVIDVKPDGTLGIKDKAGGSRKKALNSMLQDFRDHLADIDPHRVFVTHSGYCEEDAKYLCDELRKLLNFEELNITTAGATVSSHCGPKTIGILYTTFH
jgi:DegV family protein with EDD domain